MATFWRIWSPTRGYWLLEPDCYGDILLDEWTPYVWEARPENNRKLASDTLKQLQTEPHGERKKYPPCPDARLLRVTVRRTSREARPDESSETLKTLAAGLRAFAERELVAPEARPIPPGATVYTFKIKDQPSDSAHLADLYVENAALTEALKMARMHHEASISIANADRAALRARVSELEAQLADRTDALRTFQNVPREE